MRPVGLFDAFRMQIFTLRFENCYQFHSITCCELLGTVSSAVNRYWRSCKTSPNKNRARSEIKNVRPPSYLIPPRLICGNKMATRCNRGFYCRSFCLHNMFRAPLCPSSGAQEYYTVVAACGISCCGFQVAGLVWS